MNSSGSISHTSKGGITSGSTGFVARLLVFIHCSANDDLHKAKQVQQESGVWIDFSIGVRAFPGIRDVGE